MASQSPNLPETMRCPETGRTLRRDVRPFTITYKGISKTVDLPGYYPEDDGESVHVGDDMVVTDEALRTLKEEVDRIPSQHTIRRIRKKLGLSQREASRILGGGPNAFEKYERGEVEPSRVMGNLLYLLDRHPELLNDLRGAS